MPDRTESPKTEALDARTPVSNVRKTIAWIVAAPTALFCLGALTFNGVLPDLPSGPADEAFLQAAFWHLFALLIVGGITYHAVLSIELPFELPSAGARSGSNGQVSGRRAGEGGSSTRRDSVGGSSDGPQSASRTQAFGSERAAAETPNVSEALDQLERLNALRESGALSEDEFSRLKGNVLADSQATRAAVDGASAHTDDVIDPAIVRKYRIRKSMSGTYNCDGKSFATIEEAVDYAKTLE